MTPPTGLVARPVGPLATIIPLPRAHEAEGPRRAIEILERWVGPGWDEIPADAGRAGLRAQRLLGEAPARLDPETTSSIVALAHARQLVVGARAALELLTEEVATLSEALGLDLGALVFDQLDAVAAAVLNLGAAPAAVPAWGRRSSADGASVVLDLVGPGLRDARAAHEALYERFTDNVWEIPADLLVAGTRRWRVISRRRLRRWLRSASRSGAVRGSLRDVAQEIVDARAVRARLVSMRSLLAQHLGDLDRGVLTDVDSAAAALEAVRRLHRALDHLCDEARLERLLLADAFRSQELLMPAWSIRTTLAAWVTDVVAAGGRDALSLDGDGLADWTDQVERHLPSMTAGLDSLARTGSVGMTLQRAVDTFILREHVADAMGLVAEAPADDVTDETDVAPEGAERSWSGS